MIFIVEIMNFRHLGIFKVYTKERRKLNDDVLWKWDNWKWNDYFYTTILTPGMKIFTTVLSGTGSSIARMDGQVIGNMQNMLYDSAAFVLFIIPLIVLYLFTQKGFVQSIERSGLVGYWSIDFVYIKEELS